METRAPQWTDSIANSTLCDYFYIFFVIFSVWAGLSLLAGIWVFSSSKMTIGMLMAVIINILLSFGISATSALFLYLICERALKPALQRSSRDGFVGKAASVKHAAEVHDPRYCQGGGFTPEPAWCP